MANVSGLLSCTILDHLGVTASFPVYVDVADTTTLADVVAEAHQYQDLLDAIIDGAIVGCEFKLTCSLDTANIKAAPAPAAEVERNALFNFSQANYKYKQGFAVPTIAEGKIVSGKVNLADADILAFVNMLVTGLTHLKFASKFLQALLGLLDVVISFRKHRKRETAVSFEENT